MKNSKIVHLNTIILILHITINSINILIKRQIVRLNEKGKNLLYNDFKKSTLNIKKQMFKK